MKNKYDKNMSKSNALPDMNTTHDDTSPLNSVLVPGHRFAPQKSNLAARKSTFHLVFSKINFTMIISLFETINWSKKKKRKKKRKFRFSSTLSIRTLARFQGVLTLLPQAFLGVICLDSGHQLPLKSCFGDWLRYKRHEQ